ncbi:MlaD family protein [Alphaproteobacteria bacterium]|nr:MlaD family protein [Alphaproteobacteria bacterium]
MRYSSVEILMGAVVLVTAISFLILGLQSINTNQKDGYRISLIFGSSAGLKTGDSVKISGIDVGKIIRLDLDLDDYNAKIHINLSNEVKIPEDSSARITSSSLLGGNFLDIIPGSSETFLKPNDIIYDTSDSVSFIDMLGKMIFSGNKN